jgi:hypothetical protein
MQCFDVCGRVRKLDFGGRMSGYRYDFVGRSLGWARTCTIVALPVSGFKTAIPISRDIPRPSRSATME